MGRVLLIAARVIFTPLLFLLVGLVFVGCIAIDAVDRHLLSADFYLTNLEENDAYARVVDEVLLEAEQADIADQLVAHSNVTKAEMLDLIREVVQVDWLHDQVDTNLHSFFAYVRGNPDDLVLVLDLGPVLERMQPAVSTYLINQLGEMQTEPVDSYREFRDGLDHAMEMIQNGDPVIILPTYALSDAEREDLLDSIFAPDGPLAGSEGRPAVDDALRRQDTAAALIAVVNELISDRLAEATGELSDNLDEENRLDLVAQLADDQEKTREDLLSEYEDGRRAADLLTSFGPLLGAVLLIVLTALLGAIYLPGRLSSFLVPGITLVFWAGLGLAAWLVFRSAVPVWARERVMDLETDPDTDLSASGISLLADIADRLARDISDSFLRPSVVVLLLGTALIAAGIILRWRSRSPAARDVLPSPAPEPDWNPSAETSSEVNADMETGEGTDSQDDTDTETAGGTSSEGDAHARTISDGGSEDETNAGTRAAAGAHDSDGDRDTG